MNILRKIGLCALLPGFLGFSGLKADPNARYRLMAIMLRDAYDNVSLDKAKQDDEQAKKARMFRAVLRGNDGDLATLKAYLDNGWDQKGPGNVNLMDENKQTLLHVAVDGWNVDGIKLLLVYGANVDAINKAGVTPFMAFLKAGHHRDEANTEAIIFYSFMKRTPRIEYREFEHNFELTKRFCSLLHAIHQTCHHLFDDQKKKWLDDVCANMLRILEQFAKPAPAPTAKSALSPTLPSRL